MTTWNDFFWPLVVLGPRNPTVQVAVSTLVERLRRGLRARPDRHVRLDPPAADRVPRPRPPHHQRDHERGGQGMSLPARFRLGGRHRRVPDRGRSGCRRPRRVDLGPLLPHAREGRERRHRRPRLRSLPPLARRPRPDEPRSASSAYRFSIAWPRIQPDGRGASERQGHRLLPPAGRRDCSSAGSRPSRRSTTGICRSAFRTRAAGPRARSSTASPTMPSSSSTVSATSSTTWVTHNEPWVTVVPRLRLRRRRRQASRDWQQALAAAHHVLLSHGRAVHGLPRRWRAAVRSGSRST